MGNTYNPIRNIMAVLANVQNDYAQNDAGGLTPDLFPQEDLGGFIDEIGNLFDGWEKLQIEKMVPDSWSDAQKDEAKKELNAIATSVNNGGVQPPPRNPKTGELIHCDFVTFNLRKGQAWWHSDYISKKALKAFADAAFKRGQASGRRQAMREVNTTANIAQA